MTGSDILRIWEGVESRRPVDRALALVCCAFPDRSPQEVAALPVGQRDAWLLQLREQTLGPELHSTTKCPRCGTQNDLVVPSRQLAQSPPAPGRPGPHELSCGPYWIRFRLPNSLDVAAMAERADPATAVRGLLAGCVLAAQHDGSAIESGDLPVAVVDGLAAAMARLDPQGEILFLLHCPSCAHDWEAVFDIAAFFLAELAVLGKRLVREVHTLAQAYGWREADILALSNRRRWLYLEAVGG